MEKAAEKLPIIISEFGGAYFKPGEAPPRPRWGGMRRNDGDWLMRVLQAIEEHKWSYTAWDFHPAAGPTLISGWDYKPTPHFGAYVKQMLAGKLPSYTPPDPSETPAEPAPVDLHHLVLVDGDCTGTGRLRSRAGVPAVYTWLLETGK